VQAIKAPLLLLTVMLLSASMVQARTSDLQGTTVAIEAMNARTCIALKFSALPDRYYDCVRQALALNATRATRIEPSAQNASTETPSVTLRLAQNTTTEVINNGVAQTPRVISRPQLVTEEASNSDQITDQSTGTELNAQTDTLPAWLPESAKAWLGSVLSEEQLELLSRNWLKGLLAIGALILLPLVLSLISRTVRRDRYAHTRDFAPADTEQTENLFDDLDLKELGITENDVDTKKVESGTQGADEEISETAHQASSTVKEAPVEQTDANAGKGISSAMAEGVSDHDETAQLHESLLEVQAAAVDQDQGSVNVLKKDTADPANTTETITREKTTESADTSASNSTITPNGPQSSPTALPTAAASARESVNLADDKLDTRNRSDGDNGIETVAHDAAATAESDKADDVPTERRPLTRFGSWLHDLPHESGKPASMEAFMYWVSYSDGNIKPGLAEELAVAEELDDHGRIKKAVLSFKPEVFDDILLSLGKHLDHDSKRSFLDLMLAVLVNNSQPTPVQNLLFRFYADYTGMGATYLNDRFETAFARELPGIPRPDRALWWDKQTDKLTESTSTSSIDINLQTLGLNRSATAEDIDAAYRLAEKRHDPVNFKGLGEKEQALAERSFSKYRKSHELLTEIEA